MMEFNESNRIAALVGLATTLFHANQQENRSRAAGILNRVRGLMPARPENAQEMSQIFSVVGALAPIDSSEAIGMIELLVDQMNQIAEAYAVVNAFQGGGSVRQGEYLLQNGPNFGVYVDMNVFRGLATVQPERVGALVDAFSRREMRVMMRLSLLEDLR